MVYEWLLENYGSVLYDKTMPWSNRKKYDFILEAFKIILEVDGRQHFQQVSNWQAPETQHENDFQKMITAKENGYSVIRIFQEDVYNNKMDWKTFLKNNIQRYETRTFIYLSSDIDIYNPIRNAHEKINKK